jgi:senataxin
MYDWQVFSTLSFSGSTLFSKWNRGFDVVIIDEAAQAVSSHNFVFLISLCELFYFILLSAWADIGLCLSYG